MKRSYCFLSALLFSIFICKFSIAQDFSNKGKEFWFCFPNHIPSGSNGSMSIWITSDQASSGTITMTNGAFSANWSVAANGITSVNIPHNLAHISNAESGMIIQKSLKLSVNTGQPPVVAYAQQYGNARSAATLLLPTNVLGKKYRAASFTYSNTSSGGQNSRSQFQIIATRPLTQVKVTPFSNGVAGTPFNINFTNTGDMYQYQATTDVTGTLIESVAGSGGTCLPIAVFSGSSAATIFTKTCTPGNTSYDPLFQQMYPVSTWGKNFGFIPFGDYTNGNPYRVMASEDNTQVFMNGTLVATLNAGQIYSGSLTPFDLTPVTLTTPTSITADKPISVIEYAQCRDCSGTSNGDPDMVVLNPIEQNIKDITIFTSTQQNINRQWINVLIPTVSAGSFRIDGAIPSTPFQPAFNIPGYSYLQHQFTPALSGSHRISADTGFNAICYGFQQGQYESYAYSAGTNVKDLNSALEINNEFGIENYPNACTGSPFKFKIYLPDETNGTPPTTIRYDSIRWDCSNVSAMIPASFPYIQYGTPLVMPDSVNIRNGKNVAWYSVPGSFSFITPGVYTITITAYRTSNEGCGNAQTYEFPLTVTAPPVADFNFATALCTNSPIQFTDVTPPSGSVPYRWWWEFGDPPSGANNNSNLQNPTHTFSNPGTYSVRFSNITRAGCLSDTATKLVDITNQPTANFTVPAINCVNTSIPFTDVSTLVGPGSINQWDWNFGDPASGINNTSTLQNPTHIFATPGNYTVTLNVKTNTNCASAPYTFSVEIKPDATITLSSGAGTDNQTICINSPIANITYAVGGSGTGGTVTGLPAGLTGTYAAGVITISGTPTVSGTFNYTVSTLGPCLNVNANGTINVTADGTINLSSPAGSDNQTICINTPLSLISYAVGGSGTGGTVTGLPAGITGNFAGGVISITGTPTVSGVFNYTVNTTGPCVTPTATGTITITPDATINLTSAPGTDNQTKCINTPITNITYAIGGSGTGGSVTGLPAGVTGTYAGGIITISGTPTVSGTFNYTVNTTGPCVKPSATGTITITPDATVTLTSGVPSANQELCVNATITNITYAVGGTGNGGTVTGLPTGVTGSYAGGIITISGTPTVSGTFNYIVTANGPCLAATANGTIIVNALPNSNFNFTSPTCDTRTINFTDISVPNSGTVNNWQWNFGDPASGANNTSVLQNPSHLFTATGTYNVGLVVTTDKGCVSIEPTKPVVVNHKPKTGFMVPEVCINDVATVFTDTSTIAVGGLDPTGYYWDFGDPASGVANFSTVKNGSHLYTAIGPYNVMHVSTSLAGCKDTVYHTIFINAADPVADFNIPFPTTMCANDSVSIINRSTISQGSVTKLEIYWDVVGAPGVFETIDDPVFNATYKHKYPTQAVTQTYTIRMIAYSGAICFSNKVVNITVNAAPVTQFLTMPNVCFDAIPFQITQASETGGVPGTAFYSGSGVSSTGIFTPASVIPGSTNTIKYLYVATAGGCRDSVTQTITVWDTASAKINIAPITCEKNAITFNSSASTIPAGAGTINSWSWNFGDPPSGALNTSTVANPSHTYNNWGNYTVSLQVGTSNGCKSTAQSIPVKVNPLPKPDFTLPSSACLPAASIVFNSNVLVPDGSTPAGYLWNFGDPASGPNNTATSSTPTHIFNTTGPFTIKLISTTNAGCVDSISKALTTIHPQPIGSFNVDKVDVCIGGSMTFTNTSNSLDGTTTQYHWSLDNGDTRNIPSFTYTYPAAGTYNVSLFIYNSHGCKSSTAVKTVSANLYPVANAGPDKIMLEGGQVELTPVLVTNLTVNYSWTPVSYLNNPNIANAKASPPNDFTYTLKVTSDKGCSATDQVFIKVLKMPTIPNIFSPNGDGVHDTWKIDYLDTYPGSTVDIFNRYGQKVFHSDGYTTPWDGTVNGKPVPVGTYYYIVNPKNGRSQISGYVDVIR